MSEFPPLSQEKPPPAASPTISTEIVEVLDRALIHDERLKYKYFDAATRLKVISLRNHLDVADCMLTQLPGRMPGERPGKVELILPPGKKLPFPSEKRFRAAVLPLLEDATTGKVTFQGFSCNPGQGYLNINFSGMCPIHKRYHDGSAWIWVLRQKLDCSYAGWKCWRDNSFFKFASCDQLVNY